MLARKLKRMAAGFTLIELMITIGIVGILVRIAVTNYNRVMGKSHNAEAKLALATTYMGEKNFYAQHSYYVQGMKDIAYTPEGTTRFYTIGWTAVSQSGTLTSYLDAATGATILTGTTASWARVNYPATYTSCTLATLSSTPGSATVAGQTFSIVATGQIVNAATNCDTWTINDSKTLSNTTIGTF